MPEPAGSLPRVSVATIPGDGIGKEVVRAGIEVLSQVAAIDFVELPWGSDYYERTGTMMPEDGLRQLERFEAIYLGAVGWPSVPDHVSLWGLLLPIRQAFQLYVNVRPVVLLPGIPSPLAHRSAHDIDMLFVRENSEGEYSGTGGRVHRGQPHEVAIEVSVFTRLGVERVIRYAFERARERRRTLISVTKSNASRYGYVLWDEVTSELGAGELPDVEVQRIHVDAMAARMVLQPQSIDVVVASNLFGDVLTDLGAAIQGGMGLAASANLDPTRRYPSMFEPVHGSAPDIAGQGKANPLGAIMTGALMLQHLGQGPAAARVEAAVRAVTAAGQFLTRDLGGQASTDEVAQAVVQQLRHAELA